MESPIPFVIDPIERGGTCTCSPVPRFWYQYSTLCNEVYSDSTSSFPHSFLYAYSTYIIDPSRIQRTFTIHGFRFEV